MSRILLILWFLFWSLSPGVSRAFLGWGKNYLVKINGKVYTVEDFKKWWKYWHDKNTPFPDSPEPFIEWILLSDEARAMDLQDTPSYRHKLEVFLKVRGLLFLRNEEVDQKIRVTREGLWKLYQEEFTPQVKLALLTLKDEEKAKTWAEEARKEGCEKLWKALPKEKRKEPRYWRPISIPARYRSQVVKARPGAVLGPFKEGKHWLVICVLDKIGPTPNDFKALIPDLGDLYRRREEARLTADLIERLKKKYHVQVNWKLISRIGVKEKLPPDLKDRIVLRVGKLELTAAAFQQYLKRDAKVRYPGKKKLSPQELDDLRHTVVDNIIAQTLTGLEALNRHYERREPLKSLWEFYQRQMLVRELENRVIWPRVKVTDEEVREYYEEHKADYMRPAQVVIAVIQSRDEKLMREVYRRIRQGEDFFEVAKEVNFHGVHPQRFSVNRLVPEMRKVLQGLEPGEVSGLFQIKGYYFIVKLIDRIPPSPHPFSMVKDSIKKMLAQQRFERLRKEYVEELKARSKIEINEKAWRKLVRELGA